MKNEIESVLFVGVGGDGIITASNVLAEAFMLAGFDVKKSEIHGMSQRGGSVSASVRFGKKVYSPTDKLGGVKFLIATEKIEALRWIQYINSNNAVLVINDRIVPIINQTIDEKNIDKAIKNFKTNTLIVRKFFEEAEKIGSVKISNTIMLGVLSNYLPMEREFLIKAIDSIVPEEIKSINMEALSVGAELVYV